MDISVTRFRAQCLELIRQVESDGEAVEITRHGKTVARLTPPHRRAFAKPAALGEIAGIRSVGDGTGRFRARRPGF